MNLLQQSLIYFVLIFSIRIIDGKTFLNCELAKALSKVMTTSNDRTYIPHWICLANAESQMNTSKVTDLPNRSRSYGIFQINDKEQCGKTKKSGLCNLKCTDLLDDDIRDDVVCAKKVFDQNGFKNWKQWENKCKSTSVMEGNKALPNLRNCYY